MNSFGDILTLHNLAQHPLSCKSVPTPSSIRMCVNPISYRQLQVSFLEGEDMWISVGH